MPKAVRQMPAKEKKYPFENLVFEGGGVLGYAYAGAIAVLEERGILAQCKRFAGASAGAMTAGLLACGARSSMLAAALDSLDARQLVDSSLLAVQNIYRFWHHGGWAKGERLETWYGDLLAQLCNGQRNITLAQVYARFGTSIVLTGTCLNTRETEYFCKETHPNMPLARAVRISAGYPCLFPMIEHGQQQWWDGGIGDNFPIHVFDSDPCAGGCVHHRSRQQNDDDDNDDLRAETIPPKHCTARVANAATLGFKLISKEPDAAAASRRTTLQKRAASVPINNVYDAIKSAAQMVLDMSRQLHVHEIDWRRSVLINVGTMSATHFDIDDEEKETLVSSGRSATEAFLDAF